MNIDEVDEMLTGANLGWRDYLAAGIVLAIGFALSYLVGRWRRRRLGRPDGQSQEMIGLIARVVQVLVIAIFAGWSLSRLG
ncbi:MAG: hypothetical protein ACR2QO_11570, partial [Acidimicrobiales bacterium]